MKLVSVGIVALGVAFAAVAGTGPRGVVSGTHTNGVASWTNTGPSPVYIEAVDCKSSGTSTVLVSIVNFPAITNALAGVTNTSLEYLAEEMRRVIVGGRLDIDVTAAGTVTNFYAIYPYEQ
jgi:hypothetical protein